MPRKIQSPGVEINEIDRSQYGKVDYSLPNSPTLLVTGFADRGEDYALQWMNSKPTLDETYGTPTNEFERYFYNAICEVLNRGGTCVAAKLPYLNDSFGKYNYVDYDVQLCSTQMVGSELDIGSFDTIEELQNALSTVIVYLRAAGYSKDFDITTLCKMAIALSTIIDDYKDESPYIATTYIETIEDMFKSLSSFIQFSSKSSDMFTLYANDSNLTSYLDIKCKPTRVDEIAPSSSIYSYGGMDTMEHFDSLLTNGNKVAQDTIRIYDITRTQYSKLENIEHKFVSTADDEHSNDFLGIVPVIVTPTNALFFQNLLDFSYSKANKKMFSQLSNFTSLESKKADNYGLSAVSSYLVLPMASIKDNDVDSIVGKEYSYEETLRWTSSESLSRIASMVFPTINFDGMSHFQQEHLKKIGIAVFKAFKDVDNNSKINFELVESFVGSLDPAARDPITKANIFIDDVVNASSQFIKVFSHIDKKKLTAASTIAMSGQPAVSMGFYKIDCRKQIDYAESISRALMRIFDTAQNRYTLPLDIVVDAGVSNIAQIAKSFNTDMRIDVDAMPNVADYSSWRLDELNKDVSGWRSTLKKFDDFAKYTRKDVMFIADGLRPFCLDGNVKIVRKTAPQNSVMKTIIPKLRYMSNTFDSSYTAGYCNWFYQQDNSSTDYMWIPPSIKAAGVYVYCDTYFQPWSAPAGMTRGVLNDVVDVAFVPNEDEAGKIYNAQWNYAMSYPIDGIVIEGHKTFQTQRTALDRVNVRKLLLYLEKRTARIARRFVYEGNTPYLRQLFVDTLRPLYEDAVRRDGLREYAIKCDDELNTTQVIENNEIRCRIAVKPVKTVDFIVLDFIVSRQSADVTEEVLR